MPFDFKKEYKEFYMPKGKPEIVTVPKMNYIAVRGKGNPNEEEGEYKKSIELLYGIAYTIKANVAAMDKFIADNGYENDISDTRRHHEIYLSDARKAAPEKLKTVIRHPIKKI